MILADLCGSAMLSSRNRGALMLDTGYSVLNVVYHTIPANILFDLKNHPESGYISLTTNLTIIGYETENDNRHRGYNSPTLVRSSRCRIR